MRPPIDRQDTAEILEVAINLLTCGEVTDALAILSHLRATLVEDMIVDARDCAIAAGESVTQH